MLLQDVEASIVRGSTACDPRTRRHKRPARRFAHDFRLLGPFVALAAQTLLLSLTIIAVEWIAGMPGAATTATVDGYGATTSISSTSNVSAAPPRISGGEPLSP